MQGLLNETVWTDFINIVKKGKIKELKSTVVTFNGETAFIYVNPKTDYIEMQTEYLGQLANSLGGNTADEILHGVEDAAI
jgi:hypothetical protein